MKTYLKFYKSRVANARISLDKPVNIQDLLGNIKSPHSRKHAEPLADFTELYFWDLGKKASEQIRVGDRLYIVTSNDLYVGTIDIHIVDFQGGIGDAIGWARQFKKPWDNPIGFKSIRHTPITPQLHQRIQDAIHSGIQVAPSFQIITGDLGEGSTSPPRDKIEPPKHIPGPEEYGERPEPDTSSVEDAKESEPVQVPENVQPQDTQLKDLQDRVHLLRQASHHSEREHESLVERFFEYLGYAAPTDIKYRVGHIDVLINPDSSNSMVVEVKRDWQLSRNDKEVVDQAYRYATNNGSRFVIITNGEYYAFYDRLRGLSIGENFDFEIRISQLSPSDTQLLMKYKKSSLE